MCTCPRYDNSPTTYTIDSETWRYLRRMQKIEDNLKWLVKVTKDKGFFELRHDNDGYTGYISFHRPTSYNIRTKAHACIGDAIADLVKFVEIVEV